jgi:hypothetical protein
VNKATANEEKIIAVQDILLDFRKLFTPLLFSLSQLESACTIVAKKHGDKLGMQNVKHWIPTFALRLRMLLCVVAKQQRRTPTTKLCRALWGESEQDPPERNQKRAAKQRDEVLHFKNGYEYGWDAEHLCGHRSALGSTKTEMALRPKASDFENTADNERYLATFPDGSVARMPVINGFVKTQYGKTMKKDDALWRGHKFTVVQRSSDTGLFLAVFEQTRQLTQIRVDSFGPLPGEQPSTLPDDDPVIQKCLAATLPTVLKYESHEIKSAVEFEIEMKAMCSSKHRKESIPKKRKLKVCKKPSTHAQTSATTVVVDDAKVDVVKLALKRCKTGNNFEATLPPVAESKFEMLFRGI